jgi:plasmid stabilization system protein ParE
MKVIWLKRAIHQRDNQEEWYRSTKGLDFAKTFIRNLYRAELQIREMPDIGQKEKSALDGKSVRSVLAHPQCRIIYKYDDKAITIIRLRFMMMRE